MCTIREGGTEQGRLLLPTGALDEAAKSNYDVYFVSYTELLFWWRGEAASACTGPESLSPLAYLPQVRPISVLHTEVTIL
jgi:hypothetical protein